jgi:hypothetical protein
MLYLSVFYSNIIYSFSIQVQQASDASVFTVDGTYGLSPQISYNCAYYMGSYMINLQYSQFTFVDDGNTLTVQPAMNGEGYMTGSSATNGVINVDYFSPGNCNYIFTLTGSFTDNDTWQGTFKVAFSGIYCFDCTDQSFNITGTRDGGGGGVLEFSGDKFFLGSFLGLLLIIPVTLTWIKKKRV